VTTVIVVQSPLPNLYHLSSLPLLLGHEKFRIIQIHKRQKHKKEAFKISVLEPRIRQSGVVQALKKLPANLFI